MTVMTEIKLVAAVVAIAGTFWGAWSWRDTIAENEVRNAVDSAVVKKVDEIKDKLEEERKNRVEFQEAAAKQLGGLLKDVQKIRDLRSATQQAITVDRMNYRDFYDQPIPELGRKTWLTERQAARVESPASAPSAPSR